MSENKKQLFLWHGENDYEISRQVKGWLGVFEEKYLGINISIFDMKDSRSVVKLLPDLKNALQVNSLFGSNKFVVLKNFLVDGVSEEIRELLLNSIKELSEGFFVVFVEAKEPRKTGKIYKQIIKYDKKKVAEIKKYDLPKGNDLIKWIIEKAKEYEVVLSPEVVNLLSAMIGNDLWQLDIEICKLANYKRDEKITTEDVNLLVKGKYNDDIFQLMDAISDKDKEKILRLTKDQLNSGASDMYLLSMLIRQFRIFLQIKELTKDGDIPPVVIAKEIGIHPYVAKKSVYYLRHFTLGELRSIYKKLFEFEIKMKTGRGAFELMFDLLVAEL
jgi:DNA polymerase III subunit delta